MSRPIDVLREYREALFAWGTDMAEFDAALAQVETLAQAAREACDDYHADALTELRAALAPFPEESHE